jgi:hypothetical protein
MALCDGSLPAVYGLGTPDQGGQLVEISSNSFV